MKKIDKILYYSVIFSIITHTLIIFHDQIILKLTFEPTKEQKQKLKKIEDNRLKTKYSKHKDENKKLLNKMFDKDEENVIKGAKEEFLEEINKSYGSLISKYFKGFSTLKTQREKKNNLKSNGKINISLKSNNDQSYSLPQECKKYYIGLGALLNIKPNKIWEITQISQDSVANDIGLKSGDTLLGFKTTDGRFYEGNILIPKIQKKGSNLSVIIVYKQDNILKEKNIILDKVCYTEKDIKLKNRL